MAKRASQLLAPIYDFRPDMSEIILPCKGIFNPTCSKILFARFADVMRGGCLGHVNAATRRYIFEPTTHPGADHKAFYPKACTRKG